MTVQPRMRIEQRYGCIYNLYINGRPRGSFASEALAQRAYVQRFGGKAA